MITYPLNKIDYQATDAELFHCTRNSGIYASDDFVCTVTGADNNVTIGAGIGWIRNSKFSGKVIANKSDVVLDLGLADASLNRWDIVAIQFDKNNNATDLVVKHGTPASTPVRPEIVQTEILYELYLAAFYRKAGATTINASDVYDLRLDATVCGLMADSVTEIDTTGINAQINALIEKLREEIAGIESSTEIMLKSVYDTNGNGIVDNAERLNGQPASYYAPVENSVQTYTQSEGTLTGTGTNGKFKATATGTYTSFTIGGVSYAVKCGEDAEIALIKDCWYTFILDTGAKTINFGGVGGSGNGDTVIYNATTDKLEIYKDDVFIGGLLCSFRAMDILKNGSLGVPMTYSGSSYGSVEFRNNTIYYKSTASHTNTATARTTSPIDVTNYSRLRITVNGSGYLTLKYGLSYNPNISFATHGTTSGGSLIDLDISEFKGEMYLVFQFTTSYDSTASISLILLN